MCGRVKLLRPEEVRAVVERVQERLPLDPLAEPDAGAEPRRQAFPGAGLDVIAPTAKSAHDGRALEPRISVARLTWGFPVDWQSGSVFNTRIESALEGGTMWDDAIRNGRCVVPVAAYYEPHASETVPSPRTGRPVKRVYEFAMPGRLPMLLAGVSEGGYVSLVTTEPNAIMAPIHRRMPLMLRSDEVASWFGEGFADLADRSGFAMEAVPETPLEQGQESLF